MPLLWFYELICSFFVVLTGSIPRWPRWGGSRSEGSGREGRRRGYWRRRGRGRRQLRRPPQQCWTLQLAGDKNDSQGEAGIPFQQVDMHIQSTLIRINLLLIDEAIKAKNFSIETYLEKKRKLYWMAFLFLATSCLMWHLWWVAGTRSNGYRLTNSSYRSGQQYLTLCSTQHWQPGTKKSSCQVVF